MPLSEAPHFVETSLFSTKFDGGSKLQKRYTISRPIHIAIFQDTLLSHTDASILERTYKQGIHPIEHPV